MRVSLIHCDAVGNMWVWPGSNAGVPLAGNTPTSNVYTQNNQIGGTAYDAAGNQQTVNGNSATYDGEKRMVSVSETAVFGGATATFAYDGAG